MSHQWALPYYYAVVTLIVVMVTIQVFRPTEQERKKIKRPAKGGQQATASFILISAILAIAFGIGATLLLLHLA
jgi:hypothetical protein